MILTVPVMMTGNTNYDAGNSFSRNKEGSISYFTAIVIKRFVDHPTVIAMRAFPRENTTNSSTVGSAASLAATSAAASAVASTKALEASAVKTSPVAVTAATSATVAVGVTSADANVSEVRMVIKQADLIYMAMDLRDDGLDERAFEYAWRGYHNLVKRGIIQRKSVLSICDFSQSSRNKRMYVIDLAHKKLLYRTYVAHGQNSGEEFATSFSNEPDSYKSSLGFYITQRTYMGRNGLSLRLDGVDSGYNDMAMKRQIVLHGSSYVGEKYMQDYGNLGTSLGCPALPLDMSGRIIRAVKDGSCLLIYYPTQQYLDNSAILHG